LTLIVNLFAGPGAGKSTTRAGVFYKLKLEGYNVEEAPEFAKDLTWEQRHMAFTCQPYLFAEQLFRLHRLQGQVDAVITDSPLLLSLIYKPEDEVDSFNDFVIDTWEKFNNLNYYVLRAKEYNPKGRNQTEHEAKEKDAQVFTMLKHTFTPFEYVMGDDTAVNYIVKEVKGRIDNGS
jgi:hypothetical protein